MGENSCGFGVGKTRGASSGKAAKLLRGKVAGVLRFGACKTRGEPGCARQVSAGRRSWERTPARSADARRHASHCPAPRRLSLDLLREHGATASYFVGTGEPFGKTALTFCRAWEKVNGDSGSSPEGPSRLFEEHSMGELITSAMHSTPQGFVGVGCIFIYFIVMICAIIYRVRRGEHVH